MPEKKKTHRPPGVVLVGRLLVLQALYRLGTGVYWVVWNNRLLGGLAAWPDGYAPVYAVREVALWSAVILHGILLFVAGVGMLRLSPRAWIWGMALQGVGLGAGLFAYFRGRPDYLSMALGVVVVLLLNQNDVQAAFRRASGPPDSALTREAA